MKIDFVKMVGSGNDFIVIDNRDNIFNTSDKNLIRKMCNRTEGIGSDGILAIERSKNNDFTMNIINSDASIAEMCGNGARCAAYYAYIRKIADKNMKFDTLAGLIEGHIISDEDIKTVKVKMTEPHSYRENEIDIPGLGKKNIHQVNTGVPHAVIFADDIENTDVQNAGCFVRYHDIYKPKGTNVNFVKIKNNNEIIVRTYERGVEAETLSCGSGSTASALVCALKNNLSSPISVNTRGGELLKIYFEIKDKNILTNVFLEGAVRIVFEGKY